MTEGSPRANESARHGRHDGQRGAALVIIGVALAAILAATVVGIDVARLAFTATEVQAVADVAALAGARALFEGTNVVADAQLAVSENSVDGSPATIAPADVEIGNWDFSSYTFTPGVSPLNAVRATGRATVANLIAGIWGDFTTDVEKVAVAGLSCPGSDRPTLPLVLGDCHFTTDCCDAGGGGTCPHLTQVPSTTNNSAWTGFFDGANKPTIDGFIPEPCGGGSVPEVSTGDNVELNNGQINPLLEAIECLLENGMTEFVIPIVDCGEGCGVIEDPASLNNISFNQQGEVCGFAVIRIIDVVTASEENKTGEKKGITLESLCETDDPGGPLGGGCYGKGQIILLV